MTCPANTVYQRCMAPCPASCATFVTPKACEGPCVEGCASLPGYIYSDTQSLPLAHCGCTANGVYHKLGDSFVTADCSQLCTCASQGVVLCEPYGCPAGESCTVANSTRGCFRGEPASPALEPGLHPGPSSARPGEVRPSPAGRGEGRDPLKCSPTVSARPDLVESTAPHFVGNENGVRTGTVPYTVYPTLRRWRLAWSTQPGLHSRFQDYIVRPCLSLSLKRKGVSGGKTDGEATCTCARS